MKNKNKGRYEKVRKKYFKDNILTPEEYKKHKSIKKPKRRKKKL